MDGRGSSQIAGRSLSDFEPLSTAEVKLIAGCRTGEMVSLGATRPEAASPEQTVRSAFIRFLALGGDARAPVHEHGVQLEGAWLVGSLDLWAARIPVPLVLHRCRLQQLTLLNAKLDGYLDLEGSLLPYGLQADNFQCAGGICLRNGFRAEGEVLFANARIGSFVDCWGGHFVNPEGTAIDLSSCIIGKDVLLFNDFRASGQVFLATANIGGFFLCEDATFSFPGGKAIDAEGATIGGSLILRDSKVSGELSLFLIRIGGLVQIRRATIQGSGGSAVNFGGADIAAGVDISDKVEIRGSLDFTNGRVGGTLNISDGNIEVDPDSSAVLLPNTRVTGGLIFEEECRVIGCINLDRCEVQGRVGVHGGSIRSDSVAFSAVRATIAGDVVLADGIGVQGLVDLSDAEIAGSLRLNGFFEAMAGRAVAVESARVTRSVDMTNGFRAQGEVSLHSTQVGGWVNCEGGIFDGNGQVAINGEAMQIAGSLFLRSGFQAKGNVNLASARIGHNLECTDGFIDGGVGECLTAWRTDIGGDLNLGSYVGLGTTNFIDAKIGNNANCFNATFQVSGGIALSFAGAVIHNDLGTFWNKVDGEVDLSSVRAGSLTDAWDSWSSCKGHVLLDGLSIARFGNSARVDAKSRTEWLDSQRSDHLGSDFRPQPWEHCIAVLRAMGHPNAARDVAIAKQKRLRAAGRISWTERPFHYLYGLLVGYGYRPSRLVGITVAVWLLCALAYWSSAGAGLLLPKPAETAKSEKRESTPEPANREKAATPAAHSKENFSPLAYSADVLLPVDLGYKDAWSPQPAGLRGKSLRIMWWLEAVYGWAASLLIVGVITSLLKRD